MAHVNPVEVPTQQGCALDARMVVCATTPFVVAWAMDRDSARCVFELYTYDRNVWGLFDQLRSGIRLHDLFRLSHALALGFSVYTPMSSLTRDSRF